MSRQLVYKAIDGERDYQDARRGNSARENVEDNRDLGSLILLSEHYLSAARTEFAGPHPEGKVKALHMIRKTTALLVMAMEKHGVYERAS